MIIFDTKILNYNVSGLKNRFNYSKKGAKIIFKTSMFRYKLFQVC